MDLEERANEFVQHDPKDHCVMQIGGFKFQFGDPTKMTLKAAEMIVGRVRRAFVEEARLMLEEWQENAPIEKVDSDTAVESESDLATLAEQVGATDVDALMGSLQKARQLGIEMMREAAMEQLGTLFPRLDGNNKISIAECRAAIIERLKSLDPTQAQPRAAA